MSREIHKLKALGAFESWIKQDLDARLGLAMAAGAVRVDEGELAVLWLVKSVECTRARAAVANMAEGDEEAIRAHNAQRKPKGNGAPHE